MTVSGARAHDRAAGLDDELVAERVRGLGRGRRVLGVHDDLQDALLVAQVDEDEPAVVAARRDPAGDGQGLADVLGPQRAAAQVTPPRLIVPTRHLRALPEDPRASIGRSGSPGARRVVDPSDASDHESRRAALLAH